MEGRRPGVRGGAAGRLPSSPRAPGSPGRRLPGELLSLGPPSAILGLALRGDTHGRTDGRDTVRGTQPSTLHSPPPPPNRAHSYTPTPDCPPAAMHALASPSPGCSPPRYTPKQTPFPTGLGPPRTHLPRHAGPYRVRATTGSQRQCACATVRPKLPGMTPRRPSLLRARWARQ